MFSLEKKGLEEDVMAAFTDLKDWHWGKELVVCFPGGHK